MTKVRAWASIVAIVLSIVGMSMNLARSAPDKLTVEVVDVDGTIDAGMAHRVAQAVVDAKSAGAHAIMLRIATNGGAVDDANTRTILLLDGARGTKLDPVLAGKGGGSLKTGRHLRSPKETPLTNLYLAMLDRMGAPTASFGDGTGQLTSMSG